MNSSTTSAGLLGLLAELDRRVVDHLVGDVDLGVGPHGQREGVGRARVDLDLGAVDAQRDAGVEGVVAQLRNRDLLTFAFSSPSIDVTRSCVIGRGVGVPCSFIRIAAASGWPIQMGRNLLPSRGLEQHDRLLADHVEGHPVDAHLLHPKSSIATLPWSLIRRSGSTSESGRRPFRRPA